MYKSIGNISIQLLPSEIMESNSFLLHGFVNDTFLKL